MHVAVAERREAGVLGEVGALEHDGEPLPELLLGAPHDEPAVGRLERLERHERRVGRVVRARRRVALGEVPRRGVGQQAHRGVVERQVAVGADAVAARGVDAGEQGDRGDEPAAVVHERQARLLRRAAGLPGERHPAAERLQHVVVAGLAGARTGHAEAGQRAADDPRVDVGQVGVPDAELRRDVAAQVGVDGVGAADQVVEHLAPGVGPDVEQHRRLVLVERLEEQRVAVLRVRRDVAPDVAARRRVLDLDDLGPELGEVHRPERPGAVLLERDDPDVLERLHLLVLQATAGPRPAGTAPPRAGRHAGARRRRA